MIYNHIWHILYPLPFGIIDFDFFPICFAPPYYACRDNNYDLVALTETHLSPDIDDDEINLDGYELFQLDRNRHGGGVAIYCRSELEPKSNSKLSIQNIEMLWIETFVQNKKIIFGVCYRPPNQNTDERSFFLEGLQSVFDEVLDTIKLPFILLGDFKDRSTSWGKDNKNSELKFDLVNLINSYNFSQLINEPTRNDSIP